MSKCPICLSVDDSTIQTFATPRDASGYRCDRCGKFEMTRQAQFAAERLLTPPLRSELSFRVFAQQEEPPVIKSDFIEEFARSTIPPTPPFIASRLLALIAKNSLLGGDGYFLDFRSATAKIGALNIEATQFLYENLAAERLVMRDAYGTVRLTFQGWARYESDRTTGRPSKIGFMAMKFDDPTLEALVNDVIKPEVSRRTGHEVIDMRNVARAGVIDNLMREQIRDAAFVLVDLSHNNPGAYWEAGYAEGLGKPVIYLCEKTKFEEGQSHFDTNHSTTVLWNLDDTKLFAAELVATIRRSLNLFN